MLLKATMMKKVLFVLLSAAIAVLASCATEPEPQETPALSPDSTIEDVARVVESPAIAVRGYGIVAGLFGTGSSECPPQLRQILEKYIWQQLPEADTINPRRFIDSPDTAVVEVLGVIPPMATAGQSFDVVVRPLSSTQTTSLNGGYLYTTELKELSRITQFNQYAKTIAKAQGAIFTPPGKSKNDAWQWYVLGGGYSLSATNVSLLLNQPDFLIAAAIRNRINERFGPKVANAVSPGEVLLTIPPRYHYNKQRFLMMIRRLYIDNEPALREQRIAMLIEQLRTEADKTPIEAALEAFGKPALDHLRELLDDEDAAVRFHAARCSSNLGYSAALSVLRDFVFDSQSPYRIEAIRTIGRNARLNDAEPIFLLVLAQEKDTAIRVAAYEAALAAKSSIVTRIAVAGTFFVDLVNCSGEKLIYAKQQNQPGFVIFGTPIRCNENIFLQSDDGQITINARPGDRFISISRTHPKRPRLIGPLSAGFEVSQLIRAMAESPEQKKGSATLPGLALSYTQIIEILEKMCTSDQISARFEKGPMTTVGEMFENF
jgi:flagellar basal body P-ring protein FlgI